MKKEKVLIPNETEFTEPNEKDFEPGDDYSSIEAKQNGIAGIGIIAVVSIVVAIIFCII